MRDLAFVVPVKRFDRAKDRLRLGGLANVDALARELATSVVRACAPHPVIVLSESPDVTQFARDEGADVLESTASTLNEAVTNAYEYLGERFDTLVIVHGDLRYPDGLGNFRPEPGVTVVSDHHGEGTNVLAVPTRADFHFHFGAHSAPQHVREARRLGLGWRLVTDSPWRFDVDEPSDLDDA